MNWGGTTENQFVPKKPRAFWGFFVVKGESMNENLVKILEEFKNELKQIQSEQDLNSLRVKYLGKSGAVTEVMKLIKYIPA